MIDLPIFEQGPGHRDHLMRAIIVCYAKLLNLLSRVMLHQIR